MIHSPEYLLCPWFQIPPPHSIEHSLKNIIPPPPTFFTKRWGGGFRDCLFKGSEYYCKTEQTPLEAKCYDDSYRSLGDGLLRGWGEGGIGNGGGVRKRLAGQDNLCSCRAEDRFFCTFLFVCGAVYLFKIGSCYVAQASFELVILLLRTVLIAALFPPPRTFLWNIFLYPLNHVIQWINLDLLCTLQSTAEKFMEK
jgi:hypothetical protein